VPRYESHQNATAGIRPSGIPTSVSTPVASLMALSPVPIRPAPGFTLVDQSGRTLSLDSFKGRSVVLEFADPHCTDVCPIISQEMVDAYRDLGSSAAKVVLVSVNVNPYERSVGDVAAYSRAHQLDTVPSWHFFTGPVQALEKVWHRYGVEVDAPSPTADVIHSTTMYFIDPNGHERYVATPQADYTSSGRAYLPPDPLASWGQGIALVVRSMT
jgi:cytochrome oxidase Cu insertion factor (SCO1/SenC/PrrC family)